MKKIFILFLVAISFVFFSCKKETVNSQTTSGPVKTINPAVDMFESCGNWVVTGFVKDGVDLTTNFGNTSLVFCPDNTFTVSNDVMSENGKWFFGTPGSDNADNPLYFHMDFVNGTNNETWKDLADVWKVNNAETGNLQLQSNDGTKTLILQKLVR